MNLLKTFYTSNHIVIQLNNYKILSWDFLTTGVILNKKGQEETTKLILSLPNEAFDVGKNNCFQGFGQMHTFMNISRKYLKKDNNAKKLIDTLKDIFEDESNLKRYDSYEDRIKNFQPFLSENMKLVNKRYEYCLGMKRKIVKGNKSNKNYNRYRILERDGFKCKLCGRGPPEVSLHIDHWTPKSRGGLDIYENLVTLCAHCNQSKHAQIPKYKIEEVLNNGSK